MAKFSKSRVWDKILERSTVIIQYPNFLIKQCRAGERKRTYQKPVQFVPSFRYSTGKHSVGVGVISGAGQTMHSTTLTLTLICGALSDLSQLRKLPHIICPPPQIPLTLAPHTHKHTLPFNGHFSGTTQVSRYHKGKTNLDFTEARDSEWQWHQLGHMQVCTLLQTDNHTSTPPVSFLQAGCSSCRPTNSVKALKAISAMQ